MIYDYLWSRYDDPKRLSQKILAGLILGGFGILLMMTPWKMVTGIVFDVRSVLLSVAGLFFGFVPTIIAVVITAVYRIYLGGGGMWMGIAVIISSGMIGLLWRHLRPGWRNKRPAADLLLIGLVVHLAMASWSLLLPSDMILPTFKTIILPLLTIYPMATLFLGLIMIHWSVNWADKKALDESRQRYEKLAEQNRAIVWETNLNGQITYISQVVNQVLKFKPEELKGNQNLFKLLLEYRIDPSLEQLRKLTETRDSFVDREISLQSKDGRRVWLSVNGMPVTDPSGMITGFRGIATDVTEKKKMVDELVSAKEKAEESDRLKSAFLHNISHELRTPMNAIMGFSDLLKEAGSEEKNYYAEIVQKGSRQLLSLIEDVVTLSRLQSEKIPVNNVPFKPAELIRQVIRQVDFRPLSGKTEILTAIPSAGESLTFLADHDKIGQVLSILLSNAIKYTPEGTIQIGFTCTGNHTGFFVTDTGIGIPEHEQKKIFQSFYRGEEAINRTIGGTGLGLTIARELVNLLNGNIDFSSAAGKGSSFWFNIPLAPAPYDLPAESSPAPQNRKPISEACLLIAEDEHDNFLYLELLLKNIVKQTELATNGKEALKLAATREYDLILMDLKMPVMNGFEATREIKRILPGIPVIAQTAYALPEEMQAALESGCDDYLKKPISINGLMEVLKKYFS